MNIETIKASVDRKIDRYLKDEDLTFPEITERLEATIDNFTKLLNADANSEARKYMLSKYISFSKKRINDIDFGMNSIAGNEFFAGITDADLIKLIRLKDKISQDVLEGEFN